jgi:hypothetical protein
VILQKEIVENHTSISVAFDQHAVPLAPGHNVVGQKNMGSVRA